MEALKRPGVYASVAALLAVVGLNVSAVMWAHIVDLVAAIFAVLGIGAGFVFSGQPSEQAEVKDNFTKS